MPTATTPLGWTASTDPISIGVVSYTLPGTTEHVMLKAETAPVLLYLARRFDAEVEKIEGPILDEWGWSFRPNRNDPGVVSEHAAGTALDINAVRHPNGAKGTFTDVQVAAIHAILDALGGAVRWGGDYIHTTDAMHYEVVSPQLAAAAIARLHIDADGNVPAPIVPTPAPVRTDGDSMLVKVDSGAFFIVTGGKAISVNGASATAWNGPTISVTAKNWTELWAPVLG